MARTKVVLWILAVGVSACGEAEKSAPPPLPAAMPPPAVTAAASAAVASAAAPKRAEPPPPNPEDVNDARALVQKGAELYTEGRYDAAEEQLKGAITLYPFLPEANLLLGKIFLLRASATRDIAMMNNARLMFEMARALDPNGQEVRTLLELFHSEAAP